SNCLFLLQYGGQCDVRTTIYELFKFDETNRSWLCSNNVSSDGSFVLSTPIDPLFLILPYLEEYASSRFIPYDHLFTDLQFPNLHKLKCSSIVADLHFIADMKKLDEYVAVYRFSSEKTLEWLHLKVRALIDALKKNFYLHKAVLEDERALTKLAWNIISDYVSCDWSQRLKISLDIQDTTHKRNYEDEVVNGNSSKKLCTNSTEPVDDYFALNGASSDKNNGTVNGAESQISQKLDEVEKQKAVNELNVALFRAKLTPTQKKLQKAGQKCRTLSNFFTKK
uniref:Ribonuclease HI subunit B n=1 Tax=Romanomermis culicivorax TaxID=13658 RepID=A0A915KHX8_ROMCU